MSHLTGPTHDHTTLCKKTWSTPLNIEQSHAWRVVPQLSACSFAHGARVSTQHLYQLVYASVASYPQIYLRCSDDTVGCPVEEDIEREFEWKVWGQQPQGKHKESGEISHSLESVPRRGTSAQFWTEFYPAMASWIY